MRGHLWNRVVPFSLPMKPASTRFDTYWLLSSSICVRLVCERKCFRVKVDQLPSSHALRQRQYARYITRKSECSSAVLKDRLTVSASASRPNGVRKKDLELRVAAMVKAASRQPKIVESKQSFAVWTSLIQCQQVWHGRRCRLTVAA